MLPVRTTSPKYPPARRAKELPASSSQYLDRVSYLLVDVPYVATSSNALNLQLFYDFVKIMPKSL